MKKNIPCRLAMFGSALILSALTTFPAFAAAYSGHLDTVTETSITGWAWDSDSPSSAVSVELTITGETTEPSAATVVSVSADQFRDDLNTVLGSGAHGFAYTIDWSGYAAGTYTVTASAVSGDTKIPLIGSITYKKEDTPAAVLPTPAVVVPEVITTSVQCVIQTVCRSRLRTHTGSDCDWSRLCQRKIQKYIRTWRIFLCYR